MTNDHPVKKTWAIPMVILISSSAIEAPKVHPEARESTGHINGSFPSFFNSALDGNGFKGNQSSAVS